MLVKTIKKKTKCCGGTCKERSGESNSTIDIDFWFSKEGTLRRLHQMPSLKNVSLMKMSSEIYYLVKSCNNNFALRLLIRNYCNNALWWFLCYLATAFVLLCERLSLPLVGCWITVNDPVSIENGNNDYYSYYYNDCHSNYYDDVWLLCVYCRRII